MDDEATAPSPPEESIPASVGHHREWVEALASRKPTTCNFEYSGALAEAVLLGNVAYRAGVDLEWDAARCEVTNAPQAMRFVRREYRDGWHLFPKAERTSG